MLGEGKIYVVNTGSVKGFMVVCKTEFIVKETVVLVVAHFFKVKGKRENVVVLFKPS